MYKNLKSAEFQECVACQGKSGTPVLCAGCLHNRALISQLKEALQDVIHKYKKQKRKNKKHGKMP